MANIVFLLFNWCILLDASANIQKIDDGFEREINFGKNYYYSKYQYWFMLGLPVT